MMTYYKDGGISVYLFTFQIFRAKEVIDNAVSIVKNILSAAVIGV